MLLASFKAQSQSIDTSITRCIAAKITPIIYSNGIPPTVDTITYLGVFDDYNCSLNGTCNINWILLNSKKNIVWNNYKLTEEEYNSWDGSAVGLIFVIGNYLKVKFK
jgi:hypothetical protein